MPTPPDLANLRIWLRADAETYNDGDAVGTWTDRSGNGWHATEAANKPTFKKNQTIQGLPAISFTAVNQKLVTGIGYNTIIPAGSGHTLYSYALARTIADKDMIALPLAISLRATTKIRAGMSTDTTFDDRYSGEVAVLANTWHKLAHLRLVPGNPSQIKAAVDVFLDSALSTVSTDVNGINDPFNTGLTVGSNVGAAADMLVAEVLLYKGCHTEALRLLVQQYFVDKYEAAVQAVEGVRNIGSRRVRLLRRPIPLIPTR